MMKKFVLLVCLLIPELAHAQAGVYDVTQNGLKADLGFVSDGVCTAGSASFSSATGPFVATDIGKSISIDGCGASNSTLLTTIIGFTSPSEITLGNPAGSNGSGLTFYYGTNNSVPLNDLMASLGSSCGEMWFPKGNYMFSSRVSITTPSCSFQGVGAYTSSSLWYVGVGAGNWFDVQSVNFTRFSDLTMRGTSRNWTGYTITVRNSGSGDPSGTNLHRVNIGPPPFAFGINLDTSIMTTIEDTWFVGGYAGIVGRSSASSYSNVVNVRGGQFQRQTGGAVYIGGNSWSFVGVNFEARSDGQGVAFVGDSTMPVSGLSFTGCWFGDATAQQRWITAFGSNISLNNGNNIAF